MCVGGSFFKKILPIAALAAGAYFSGGGSLAGLFGSGASAAGAGTAAASSAGSGSLLAGLTNGAVSGAGLASSAVPTMTSLLTSGAGTGIGSALTAGLNFAKDNAFMLGQGLNLAGVGSQYMANNQRMADFNSAMRANQARNDVLVNEANAINNNNLQNFSADNQNLMANNAYNSRSNAVTGAYTTPNSVYLPISESAPKEVKEANARAIGDILDTGRDTIQAGAKLNAFGDLNLNNSINLAESGRKIGTLQNFQDGNNGVLQSSVQSAFMKPRTAQTVGDALQGAGMVANAYASTRPRKSTFYSSLS